MISAVNRKGQLQPSSQFSYFRTLQLFTLEYFGQNSREGQCGRKEKLLALQNS